MSAKQEPAPVRIANEPSIPAVCADHITQENERETLTPVPSARPGSIARSSCASGRVAGNLSMPMDCASSTTIERERTLPSISRSGSAICPDRIARLKDAPSKPQSRDSAASTTRNSGSNRTSTSQKDGARSMTARTSCSPKTSAGGTISNREAEDWEPAQSRAVSCRFCANSSAPATTTASDTRFLSLARSDLPGNIPSKNPAPKKAAGTQSTPGTSARPITED